MISSPFRSSPPVTMRPSLFLLSMYVSFMGKFVICLIDGFWKWAFKEHAAKLQKKESENRDG